MKIFLTGFMGCGKSHLGKLLAQQLDFNFLDMDEAIEEKEGKTIAKIIETEGMDTFRLLEHKCLLNLLSRQKLVVGTGGGTPCFHRNMEWIRQNGLSIYLKTPVRVLSHRLQNETEKRPLIQGLSGFELKNKIEMMLAQRQHFYEQASLTFEQDKEINPKEVSEKLHALVKPYLSY